LSVSVEISTDNVSDDTDNEFELETVSAVEEDTGIEFKVAVDTEVKNEVVDIATSVLPVFVETFTDDVSCEYKLV